MSGKTTSLLYNSVSDSSDNVYHKIRISNVLSDSDVLFSDAQLIIAVSKLEFNKSSGKDSIFAEHIKYCSFSMLQFICKLFNCFLLHGFLPQAFMEVLIKPIYKKSGSLCDWNSYRPIALANCLSKLFESLLRDKLLVYLSTSVNQFGYKKKCGTDICVCILLKK